MKTARSSLTFGRLSKNSSIISVSVRLGSVIAASGTEGKITDQEIMLREGVFLKKRLAELFAKNTGKTLAQVEKDMDRDNWMSAEEAKEYGIIDEIIK